MCDLYNHRYDNIEKFIINPDELQLVHNSEVYISREEDYDIVVSLRGHIEEFEQLKPLIAFVAKNINQLDLIAQKFDRLYSKSSRFPYVIACIFLDSSNIILEYWGTEENTQFDVIFTYQEEKFILKSFGMLSKIPSDWEQKTGDVV